MVSHSFERMKQPLRIKVFRCGNFLSNFRKFSRSVPSDGKQFCKSIEPMLSSAIYSFRVFSDMTLIHLCTSSRFMYLRVLRNSAHVFVLPAVTSLTMLSTSYGSTALVASALDSVLALYTGWSTSLMICLCTPDIKKERSLKSTIPHPRRDVPDGSTPSTL